MPAPKWNNYKITNTIDGKIVIGKLEAKQPIPGINLFSEMSPDLTSDAIKAMMQHMNSQVDDDTDTVNYRTPGFGTLTWTPEKEERL